MVSGTENKVNGLSPEHLRMVREESGLSDAVIAARGYRTITDVKELVALGFARSQLRVPGLLIPLHTTDGRQDGYEYRPNTPRELKRKIVKYEQIKESGVRVDCPPVCQPMLADPAIPLWVTEGKKKADSLASRGACVIDLSGVYGFKGKNPFGGVTFLADFDHIAWNGREVRLIFDSDVLTKQEVRKALDRLTEHLQRKGAHVAVVYLPHENGKKCGVDDYLVAGHSIVDLEALIEGPRPQPQPAAPTVRLLLHAPVVMRRPLLRQDARTFSAIWPHVERTVTEMVNKEGQVVKLSEPNVTTAQQLMLVRDDGHIFGEGGDEPLSALNFTPQFPESPPNDKLWSTEAVEHYRAGVRPDPADVFRRVASVYDHYLDFSSSLSDQSAMYSLSTCLSLMTWFSAAFDVLPYAWVNGDWGSGKTKWLTIWAQTAFLGQVVTWGGSFAALRDLADLGASLGFDDCENIDDPKADPEKRALVLAGNRRGAQVPLKEQNGDRTWRTRWVNAYGPRAFNAKKKPYGALETRCLVVPLVRTDEAEKANRDPVRLGGWPCDWRQLQDDLWATALMLLPEAQIVWDSLDKETDTVGRVFEVWRAPLAVARLFERHGVAGLEATVRKVMQAAIQEKAEDPDNRTVKVVAAIGALVFGSLDDLDTLDASDTSGHVIERDVTSAEVAQKVKDLADPDENTEWATPTRVGLILKSLRIPKKRDETTPKRTRLKTITSSLALRLLRAYGLLPIHVSKASKASNVSEDGPKPNGPDEADRSASNATNAGNAGNATEDTYETSETSESGPQPNGHDKPEPEFADDGREEEPLRQGSCPKCRKADCRHSEYGWYCGLSQQDKDRLAAKARKRADAQEETEEWETEL